MVDEDEDGNLNGFGEKYYNCNGFGHYSRECPYKGKGKSKSQSNGGKSFDNYERLATINRRHHKDSNVLTTSS
jgi:hypothetical protein